jgi:hypothetical protein
MNQRLIHASLAVVAGLGLGACAAGGSSSAASHTPTPVSGALTQGLIAYSSGTAIGVLDPQTGKTAQIAALAPGAFRVAGPVWGPAPGIPYPVIYFALHDDRPMESRNSPGVIPYDWVFRADPFTGKLSALGAQADFESEGPFGLAANAHFLALTVGCCTDYEVDVLDLTRSNAQLKVLTAPPDQPALFTEGAAPGLDGLIAVRGFATGAWYFLNPSLGVLNKFPLAPGADDGPVAFSPTGKMAAISLIDHGAVIEPVDLAPILASPSPSTSASASGAAQESPPAKAGASPSASPSVAAPRHVNSRLPHVDALAWSPDSSQLAVAVNGAIQVYAVAGKDGDNPLAQFPAGGGVTGIDWSAAIPDHSLADVKPAGSPQAVVDALLAATRLPAAADTPQLRPLTQIYVWAFDSSKASPLASISDASAATLQKYPPAAAIVNYHHWTAQGAWPLAGGCIRYRVVIAGSIPAVASTFGLDSNIACNVPPSASPSGSPSAKAS